ncbi:MAG: ornithine cyclodeaminase family protein [Gemmatimonadota bacterium]|nr:ornithine cyclodeaminase family protein [Gemmatimonadota bacterium]
MTIRVLSAADIDRALTPTDAVESMRSAFSQLSGGAATVPVRGGVQSELGLTLLMPAFLAGSRELGAKIVSLFPGNRDTPPISGAVLLLDAATGNPKALLDGSRLTALRTAAGSALATELLAPPDADVLAVFGAGTQGRSHIEVISATRPLREIRIVSRAVESARRLADDVVAHLDLVPVGSGAPDPVVRVLENPAEAVTGATLIVAATTSTTPVFDGSAVAAGTHVNGVGSFKPEMQEVDLSVLTRARVVVDQREAAWEEAGDLIVPLEAGEVGRDIVDCELGEILNGDAPTGGDGHELTFFKSVGNAAQDVAIAGMTLARAESADVGVVVPF